MAQRALTLPEAAEQQVVEPQKVVLIRYTNYRGETALRRILPLTVRFASTEWHPERQWLLDAIDVERGVNRSFAMKDISMWSVEQ